MGGPENGNFPLIYAVKCPYVGGWVVQKSLKTPLRNIKLAPNSSLCPSTEKVQYHFEFFIVLGIYNFGLLQGTLRQPRAGSRYDDA